MWLYLILSWLAIAQSIDTTTPGTSRQEQLSRIKHYELIHININLSSITTIQFNAFSNEYIIELTPNQDIIPSDIRHTNGNPTVLEGNEQFFTHKSTSCHYFGKILNSNSNTSSAAISICDQRGIRGVININNDTLIIKPAAYYLDTSQQTHSFDDEHIVYKLSDIERLPIIYGDDHHTISSQSNLNDIVLSESTKRRLANNGHSKIEILMFIEPTMIHYYQSEYDNWYETLISDMSDLMNTVSNIYYTQNWGNIGKISVKIVEFELITSWKGDYLSLAPKLVDSKCQDYYNNKDCAIDGAAWIGTTATWITNYKDTSLFDNAVMIHRMKLWDPAGLNRHVAGWGALSVVCQRGWSNNNNYMIWDDLDILTRTVAHEIGHNLGADHDVGQEWGCYAADGIMGYGSVINGFSRCSVNAVNKYFNNNNGLTCLSNSFRSVKSNYDGTGHVDDGSCSDHYQCLQVKRLKSTSEGVDFDGEWHHKGCLNGNGYYKRTIKDNTWYLYSSSTNGNWIFGKNKDDYPGWAYCAKDDITDCGGATFVWKGEKWSKDGNNDIVDCSANKLEANEKISDCPVNIDYNHKVCIVSDYMLWNDGTEFSMMDGLCSSGKPVYHYTMINQSTNIETTYYLHYDEYYKYSDSSLKSSRWIISKHGMSMDGVAICDKKELLECLGHTWFITVNVDDMRKQVMDKDMIVYNRGCDQEQQSIHHGIENQKQSPAVMIKDHNVVIGIFTLFLFITLMNILCSMCRRSKCERAVNVQHTAGQIGFYEEDEQVLSV